MTLKESEGEAETPSWEQAASREARPSIRVGSRQQGEVEPESPSGEQAASEEAKQLEHLAVAHLQAGAPALVGHDVLNSFGQLFLRGHVPDSMLR